ncbi:hypothetical protein ACA910_012565 [Epithemia clementina (nom. ined.)]
MMIIQYSYSSSAVRPDFQASISLKRNFQNQDAQLDTTLLDDRPEYRPGKGRRCVYFQEEINESYSSPYSDKQETKRLWYDADEYKKFKRRYIKTIQMVLSIERDNRHDSQSYCCVLERVFDACSMTTINHDQNSVDAGATPNDLERLNELLSIKHSGRVGLESASVRRLRLDKKARRQELMNAIFEIQDDNDYPYASLDQRTRTLALVAQAISRPSRIFAAQIALAASSSL